MKILTFNVTHLKAGILVAFVPADTKICVNPENPPHPSAKKTEAAMRLIR
jgi:hypothetical protein